MIRNDLIAVFVPQKIMQIKDFLLYVVPNSDDKDIVVYWVIKICKIIKIIYICRRAIASPDLPTNDKGKFGDLWKKIGRIYKSNLRFYFFPDQD